MLKEMAALPVPAIEVQTLAAYDASDRHIPDSDLDDEQPITLLVSTTLGEVRRIRRTHAMIARGAELAAEDERARASYEEGLTMPKEGPPPDAFKSYAGRLNDDAASLVRKLSKDC